MLWRWVSFQNKFNVVTPTRVHTTTSSEVHCCTRSIRNGYTFSETVYSTRSTFHTTYQDHGHNNDINPVVQCILCFYNATVQAQTCHTFPGKSYLSGPTKTTTQENINPKLFWCTWFCKLRHIGIYSNVFKYTPHINMGNRLYITHTWGATYSYMQYACTYRKVPRPP